MALKALAERQRRSESSTSSLLPQSYVFTDGTPTGVENTCLNISANDIEKEAAGVSVRARVLDWIDVSADGDDGTGEDDCKLCDVIVAADVFYDPQVARTFVKCVAVPLLGQVGAPRECIVAALPKEHIIIIPTALSS